MNRKILDEEIYKDRIATLEKQVEKVVETVEEEREKHAKEILGYISARNNLVLRFQRKLKVQWLKLFFLVLAAVIVGLCVWSGVGYAISHLNSAAAESAAGSARPARTKVFKEITKWFDAHLKELKTL